MAEDEVGTLGPKAVGGVDKAYLREKTNGTSSSSYSSRGKPSKPDIQLDPAVLRTEKLFPVKMLRTYRPITNEHFKIGHYILDGAGNENDHVEYEDPPEVEPGQDEGSVLRIEAGLPAMLPLSEAKALFKRGIAERADEID